jgi:hypothetical protein
VRRLSSLRSWEKMVLAAKKPPETRTLESVRYDGRLPGSPE